MTITGTDNYFDDFTVGELYAHARGRTITEMDNVLLTHLAMNTAQAHFNEQWMKDEDFGQRIVFGGITASMVIGLSSQDTGEHVDTELGLDRIRFRSPVFHGDTLNAYTEVLAVAPHDQRSDVGVLTFRHYGVNQRDQIVFEGDRTVLMRRRPAPEETTE